jgi:DNA-directed RNA polymerase subunit RPC12/RpoP
MLTQIEIKTKSTNALRKEFFVKCSLCGRFTTIIKEQKGLYLVCDQCDTQVFLNYLSYKNVNKTKNFSAIFKYDKNDTVDVFKKNVLPIHSMDNYRSH